MHNRKIKDVYATVAEKPSPGGYAFAVVIRYEDGTKGQEVLNRDLRDCLIYGNGVIGGLMAMGADIPCNVVFDPRFERT